MKYCIYCGTSLPDEALFCSKCGKKQAEDLNPKGTTIKGSKGLAIQNGVLLGLGTCTDKTIVVPSTVKKIESEAFWGGEEIESIFVPNTVTEICYGAFSGCSSLEELTIPCVWKEESHMQQCHIGYFFGDEPYENSVPVEYCPTPDGDFAYCSFIPANLTSITLLSGTNYVRASVFNGCKSLKSIVLPNTLKRFDFRQYEGDFHSCKNLQYHIYGGANYLGDDNTPYFCLLSPENDKITELNIHKDCKIISNRALANVRKIIIPNDIKDNLIECLTDIFEHFARSIEFNEYKNGYYLGDNDNPFAMFVKVINDDVDSITLHENCKIICGGAFADCYDLVSLIIPKNVMYIGEDLFCGCDSLTSINVDDGNIYYYATGNCIIERKNKKIIAGCRSSVLPIDDITTIGDGAFYNCSGLTSVVIPNGTKTIGEYSFSSCDDLESVTIPNSVTKIKTEAFSCCNNLEEIVYLGTKEEWDVIDKEENWCDEITICCEDSDIYEQKKSTNDDFWI